MSTKQAEMVVSIPAGADLTGHLYKNVKLNSSGQIVLCSVDGENSVGVLQNEPNAAGRPALVAINGITKVKCAGAITAGAGFKTDNAGLAAATGSTKTTLGYVLETGAANRVVSAVLGSKNVEA